MSHVGEAREEETLDTETFQPYPSGLRTLEIFHEFPAPSSGENTIKTSDSIRTTMIQCNSS